MLSGLKVLELASVLAGPAVGQFFAELGADVVKVEHPQTGDVTRSWRAPGEKSGISAYFTSVNWGKRSIALDLKSEEDRKILDALIRQADFVIASFRPGSDVAMNLDYDSVVKISPDIIYGQVTGYGTDSQRAGYDAVVQAEAGFMYINGSPGGPPQKLPVALMDILAAHQLKEGMLLGYIRRLQTGKGSHITVSLIDAAISSLANQAANYLVGGKEPGPIGSLHPNIAPYGELVTTRDGGQIIFAIGSDRQFLDLTKLPALEGLAEDSRFTTNESRVVHRREIQEHLQKSASAMSSQELLHFCLEHHIPAGKVKKISEAVVEASSLWLAAQEYKGLRTYVAKGVGDPTPLSPPPQLDEHREQVLKEWL
jgi:crotonobetainyl-CoA:carnitine CoA-transferase CaiB-like acyl-CoA transferase